MNYKKFMLSLFEQVSEDGMSILYGGVTAEPFANSGDTCDIKNNGKTCDVINTGTLCKVINNLGVCTNLNSAVSCEQINNTNVCVPIVVNSTTNCK